MRWILGAVVGGSIVVSSAGCVSLQSRSSGYVGCPPDDIVISGEGSAPGSRTWTATCHGKRYYCTAQAVGYSGGAISCTPAGDGPAAGRATTSAEPPPARRALTPAEAAAAAARIERVRKGEIRFLRARLDEQPFVLVIDGSPNRDGTVELDWEVPVRDPGPAREKCRPKILLDGEPRWLVAGARSTSGDRETVRFFVKTKLLSQLAESKRASGYLCDDEWHLSDPSRWVLAEYVARYEEAASLGEAQPWKPPPCCADGSRPCICAPPSPEGSHPEPPSTP